MVDQSQGQGQETCVVVPDDIRSRDRSRYLCTGAVLVILILLVLVGLAVGIYLILENQDDGPCYDTVSCNPTHEPRIGNSTTTVTSKTTPEGETTPSTRTDHPCTTTQTTTPPPTPTPTTDHPCTTTVPTTVPTTRSTASPPTTATATPTPCPPVTTTPASSTTTPTPTPCPPSTTTPTPSTTTPTPTPCPPSTTTPPPSTTPTRTATTTTTTPTPCRPCRNLTNSDISLASLPSHEHHRYYVAHTQHRVQVNTKQAATSCSNYGGYLVEVNDQQEMTFLEQLLNDHNINGAIPLGVMLTSEGWQYMSQMYSHNRITYSKWFNGWYNGSSSTPRSSSRKCVDLSKYHRQGGTWWMLPSYCPHTFCNYVCEFSCYC